MVAGVMIGGALLLASAQAGGSLVLQFPALRPDGQVTVAVFSTERAWRGRKEAVRTAIRPLTGDSLEVRFDDLPPGDYAVMAYHDRNANGRLDTLPIGLPTEPYGFSRNARGTFGPPGWGAARLRVEPGQAVTDVIRLR